jgi:hypothetical protein
LTIDCICSRSIERGKSAQKDRDVGQTSLFGALKANGKADGAKVDASGTSYADMRPWTERELLAYEKGAVGFFMSGHPMERYAAEAARLTGLTTASMSKCSDRDEVFLAGIVMDFSERKTKAGKRLGLGAIGLGAALLAERRRGQPDPGPWPTAGAVSLLLAGQLAGAVGAVSLPAGQRGPSLDLGLQLLLLAGLLAVAARTGRHAVSLVAAASSFLV